MLSQGTLRLAEEVAVVDEIKQHKSMPAAESALLMLLLDRESLTLAVSKPSPLLPPCSHGWQSKGTCRTWPISRASQWSSRGLTVIRTHFLWEGDSL